MTTRKPLQRFEDYEEVKRPSHDEKRSLTPHYAASDTADLGATGLLAVNSKAGSTKVSLPPMIESTINVRSKIRYTVLSGTSTAIHSVSVNDFLGSLGGVSITSSLFRPWASSFRLRKVTMWPAVIVGTDQTIASLWWNSGLTPFNKDSEKSSDLPVGVTMTRPVVFRPPAKTLAGDWVAATGNPSANLFSFLSSAGTIIDVECDYTLSNQILAANITTSAATGGNIYYLYLDGSGGSNVVRPTHLPSTL